MSAGVINKERRLGPYVLKRPLGEGGNGQVFMAWKDNASGEPLVCVVKFPLQRYAQDTECQERFLREAKLAMRLGTHPNIVHVTDVGTHQGMPFIALEYIDGEDLHVLLRQVMRQRRRLSYPSIYNILASSATALHHAHFGATIAGKRVGVIHRDIKPANILITRDGVTKIADFGIGTTIEEGTTGNHLRGTARYMSPEHIQCQIRPEMDIYSLGVVAWEMVENRKFRAECKGADHYAQILEGKVPPLTSADVPTQLASLIEACLHSDPRQRPTASELLKSLSMCPGYSRDPAALQHEIALVIGGRRTSGATKQELAATPELVATFAVLDQLGPSSRGPDLDKQRRGEEPTVAHPRRPGTIGSGLTLREATEVAEPDAPQRVARPRNRMSHTVKLERGSDGADIFPVAKTPQLRPAWIAERSSTPRGDTDAGRRGHTQPMAERPSAAKPAAVSVSRGSQRRAWLRWLAPVVAGGGLLLLAGYGLVPLGHDETPAAVGATTARLSPTPATPEARHPDVEPTYADVGTLPPPSPPAGTPIPAEPQSTIDEEDQSAAAESSDEPEPTAELPQQAEPEVPRVEPAPARKPTPPVSVTLTLFLLQEAEVAIGRKRFRVRERVEIEVPSGVHRVRWRSNSDEEWSVLGRKRFRPGRRYFVQLRSSGSPDFREIQGGGR